jgi:hypothetical protein
MSQQHGAQPEDRAALEQTWQKGLPQPWLTAPPPPAGAPAPWVNWAAAETFLEAIGLNLATTHLRAIVAGGGPAEKLPPGHTPEAEAARRQHAEQLQASGYSLYFHPNGGPTDADVQACTLLFIEWDNLPIDEQLRRPAELNLPPTTASLETGGKSVHHYWRLDQPMAPDAWRELMRRLITLCESDPACKNPSRVMRLPGSHYWPKDDSIAQVLEPGQDPRELLKVARQVSIGGASYRTSDVAAFLDQVAPVPELPAAPEPGAFDAVLKLAPKKLFRRTDLRPDTLQDVAEALQFIPPRRGAGHNTYDDDRNRAWGLRKVIEGIGGSLELAVNLLVAHSPAWGLRAIRQVLTSGGDHISAGTFWWHAAEHGYVNERLQPPELPPPATPMVTAAELQADPDLAATASEAARQFAKQLAFTITLRDVLPDSIAIPLIDRARAFPCDPLAMLLPLLCTAASVVGRRAEIQVKEGWAEPFVLWGANLLPPSSMKSSIAGVFERPLDRWQVKLNSEHKAAVTKWKTDRAQKISDLGLTPKTAEGNEDLIEWDFEHPSPIGQARTVTVCDATFEAIGKALAVDTCAGIVSFQDELAAWYGSMQRGAGQGSTNHRPRWLSAWGGGKIDVKRATAGSDSFFVARTALSVFGSIQPDALQALRAAEIKSGAVRAGSDGLWSRFLFAQPDAVEWQWTDFAYSCSDLVFNTYQAIDALVPEWDPEQQPHQLKFEDDARALLIPQLNAWQTEANDSPAERQWFLGKLRGNSIRLAGVLHTLKLAPQGMGFRPIDADSVKRALLLSKWFLAQFDSLQPAIDGEVKGVPAPIAKLMERAADRKRKEGANAPVTVNQAQKWSIPHANPTADEVRTVFDATVALGHGRIEASARSCRWVPAAPPTD